MKRKEKGSDEFAAFSNLLGKIASVPHDELKAKLQAEKKSKQNTKKPKKA